MQPDYTCEVCGEDLEVRPNPMRTNAFTVKPCEKCTDCEGCDFFPDTDKD